MKVLFIIGNGFDINLGLKTKYSEFYEYYKSCECLDNNVSKLKKKISSKEENWSDLEFEFGKYTKYIQSVQEFDSIYGDICDNLAIYLENEENSIDWSSLSVGKLKEYLCHPEFGLPDGDKNSIKSFKAALKVEQCHVDIMSFNYTRTIEKILQSDADYKERSPFLLGLQENNSQKILLKSINHIHGYHDNSMVMGVNDISQIGNIEFRENPDILESIVKVECNRAMRHSVDRKFENLIINANIICVFGSSIGITDNYWWKFIGEELLKDKRLIVYMRMDNVIQRNARLYSRKVRETKKIFIEKANFTKEEIDQVTDRIYVGVNSNMFNLI